jgi:hypothetical protein
MMLNDALAYQVRIAAKFYNITEQKYVEIVCQRAIDQLVNENPNIAEAFDLH